jgi:hypothetical protein
MTEVSRVFADLRDIASSLNQETDQLNQRIAVSEKAIFDLKLGFTVWMAKPITQPFLDHVRAQITTHLGWAKFDDEWGLYVRTHRTLGSSTATAYGEPSRLRDTSREVRLLALKALPEFLMVLKSEAERVLKELQEANRESVLRAPVKA